MDAPYMLDTDMFSYIVNNRHPCLRSRFTSVVERVCISAITYAEARYGARKKASSRLDSLIGMFSEIIEIVPWTDADAEAYAYIRCELEKKGTPIGANDTLIAAAARTRNAILVTNNTAHFSRVPGLAVENWLVSAS